MNPSIELRIDSLIRALTESVLPELDAAPNAASQLHMCVSHLRIIREQVHLLDSFEAFEISSFTNLAHELLANASGGPEVTKRAATLRGLLNHPSSKSELRPSAPRGEELGSALEALVHAAYIDGDEKFRTCAVPIVLKHERERVMANRSMFSAMNWEPDVGLPQIETLLAGS